MSVSDIPAEDRARLAAHYRMMWRIRAFEELALDGLKEKLVLGPIHPSIGQEAVATGVCGNLEKDDVLLSTHRGHGHTLAKGADPLAMMRELFGREGGNCGGRGGSMHIADFNVGMLGANGVVGANMVIAAGAAHAIKLRRERRVVCCIFGDGAINRGPFLEGLNWAAVFELPILFVCEDNGFASTTRTQRVTAGEGASARARSIGLEAVEVDGNDLVAVDRTIREVVDRIRTESRPWLVHAKTYRLMGHTGSDPALYRSQEEVDRQWLQDPMAVAARALQYLPEQELDDARTAAFDEMQRVYAIARDTPYPPAEEAFLDVQDEGSPMQEAY